MTKFLTRAEVLYAYEHLVANTTKNGDCLLYGVVGQYHGLKVRHFGPGRVIWIYVHRLALLKKMDIVDIPKDIEASHFCHEKACVNTNHIVAEPRHIDMSRIPCMNERHVRGEPHFCFGHPGYENCV